MTSKENKLKIEYRSVDSLIPYARNARKHSEAQVAQLAASIREFGWTVPVLVDGASGLIAGHGRVMAARLLGLKQVPVIEAAWMSDTQRRAYIIADNQLPQNADWDSELLKIELIDLKSFDFDLELLGFEDVGSLMLDKEDGENDPNAEWTGMPDYSQEDQNSYRDLIVHFPNQAAVDKFQRLLQVSFGAKSKYIWFPKAEIEVAADKRFVSDEIES